MRATVTDAIFNPDEGSIEVKYGDLSQFIYGSPVSTKMVEDPIAQCMSMLAAEVVALRNRVKILEKDLTE